MRLNLPARSAIFFKRSSSRKRIGEGTWPARWRAPPPFHSPSHPPPCICTWPSPSAASLVLPFGGGPLPGACVCGSESRISLVAAAAAFALPRQRFATFFAPTIWSQAAWTDFAHAASFTSRSASGTSGCSPA